MVLAIGDVLRLERAEERPARESRVVASKSPFVAGAKTRVRCASLAASMCLQRTAASSRFAASKKGGQEQ